MTDLRLPPRDSKGRQNFEGAVKRAEEAFRADGHEPSHQIMLTHKMMGRGGIR